MLEAIELSQQTIQITQQRKAIPFESEHSQDTAVSGAVRHQTELVRRSNHHLGGN